jgi:hypothetical protein
MTHEAKGRDIDQALNEINKLDIIRAKTTLIRVEGDVA